MRPDVGTDVLITIYGIHCSECGKQNIDVYDWDQDEMRCKCLDCDNKFDVQRGIL